MAEHFQHQRPKSKGAVRAWRAIPSVSQGHGISKGDANSQLGSGQQVCKALPRKHARQICNSNVSRCGSA